MQITDRAKDVIKSGGEWISSVELENQLMAHPDVVEAASSACPTTAGASARSRASCCKRGRRRRRRRRCASSSRQRVARWQLPERWAFIDEVPKTSVGKFDKKVLRAQHADGELDIETL